MVRYSKETIVEVRRLRSLGKTYGEIQTILQTKFPKSTLAEWCSKVNLPKSYSERISKLNLNNLNKARMIAVEINKIKREEFFKRIKTQNLLIADRIIDREVAKIALAMLCLGEASKYNPITRSSFCLGSSDPRIIILFLKWLNVCYDFDKTKIRCTVQCRADQDVVALQKFWMKVTNIPDYLFYKSRIDPRTIGKPTLKKNYKGVLRVDYFDTKVQLDLESLSDLIYNKILKGP